MDTTENVLQQCLRKQARNLLRALPSAQRNHLEQYRYHRKAKLQGQSALGFLFDSHHDLPGPSSVFPVELAIQGQDERTIPQHRPKRHSDLFGSDSSQFQGLDEPTLRNALS